MMNDKVMKNVVQQWIQISYQIRIFQDHVHDVYEMV